jgi:hypothetical protein
MTLIISRLPLVSPNEMRYKDWIIPAKVCLQELAMSEIEHY